MHHKASPKQARNPMHNEANNHQLEGSVDRVTFHNASNGFCVLRVQARDQKESITVTGHLHSVAAGAHIQCQGQWYNDSKHGLQFRADTIHAQAPTSQDGMEQYLASGMIPGIGPHFAKKLIKAFGTDVFKVIEETPQRLATIPGIGKKKQAGIIKAWKAQKSIRRIMVFLQSHGVGTARAVRIYKTYGDQAIDQVKQNPYRLALDIHGIGFKTADRLAESLGIAKTAMIRAEAGLRHTLVGHCQNGHCAAPRQALLEEAQTLLAIPESTLITALEHEVASGNLVADQLHDEACLYPAALYHAETRSAALMHALLQGETPWGALDTHKALPWVEAHINIKLAPSQSDALTSILKNKVNILTGGPGVGKTTLVHALIHILKGKDQAIGCAAPTGRAAKRLQASTGLDASTLHRLLAFDPQALAFRFDEANPLPLDVLIVDEASMLDINLFHHVLKALPEDAALLLIGDMDQLPSVGSGSVLADLIASDCINTVRLTEVFRQAATSSIITNAHRVNEGFMPRAEEGGLQDFYTWYTDEVEAVPAKIVQLMQHRLPQHLKCNPVEDIQVLTPMNRGGLGCQSLNLLLQEALNPRASEGIERFGQRYAPGDKVIQTRNNYDKAVFNGDIGRITEINAQDKQVHIQFDQTMLTYTYSELDELQLAYAISIHKSQGSEFPVVVIPMAMQHYRLLARNLLYTAITRGRRMVVVLGEKKAIAMAVGNHTQRQRLTYLDERLRCLCYGS